MLQEAAHKKKHYMSIVIKFIDYDKKQCAKHLKVFWFHIKKSEWH